MTRSACAASGRGGTLAAKGRDSQNLCSGSVELGALTWQRVPSSRLSGDRGLELRKRGHLRFDLLDDQIGIGDQPRVDAQTDDELATVAEDREAQPEVTRRRREHEDGADRGPGDADGLLRAGDIRHDRRDLRGEEIDDSAL